MTGSLVKLWYRDTIMFDRARVAQINALIEGRPGPVPTDPVARIRSAFPVAMRHDADVFRAWIEVTSLIALPEEVMARPGLPDRIMEVAAGHDAIPPPGPSRGELLRMLG